MYNCLLCIRFSSPTTNAQSNIRSPRSGLTLTRSLKKEIFFSCVENNILLTRRKILLYHWKIKFIS